MGFYLVVSFPAGKAKNFSKKLQKENVFEEGWKVAALQVVFPTDQKKKIYKYLHSLQLLFIHPCFTKASIQTLKI